MLGIVTKRWTKLKTSLVHHELFNSRKRFLTVHAGRRSYKTELSKRKIVSTLFDPQASVYDDPRYFCGAPTREQAKRIYWDDLKALIPPRYIIDKSESELYIKTILNSSVCVVGLDKPERIEGTPWDGGILDEYGNMKAKAWPENVRPALSDRHGWCWLIGVPEGRNHYYDLDKMFLAEMTTNPNSDVGSYWWRSELVLDPEEIQAAKKQLDELTYEQEFGGSFISFQGRAYYSFEENHNCCRLEYNPKNDLILCFDFNVNPGICEIVQEFTMLDDRDLPIIGETVSGVIGEVYIPRNSNTPMVCKRVINDYKKHQGNIKVYGDATGGSSGTAKLTGSDWEIIEKMLCNAFGSHRVFMEVPRHNPTERSRINAVNSRLRSLDGIVRLFIDPSKAPFLVKDLEGVRTIEGGSGEIDKKRDPKLTHCSDALGYYVVKEYPITERIASVVNAKG